MTEPETSKRSSPIATAPAVDFVISEAGAPIVPGETSVNSAEGSHRRPHHHHHLLLQHSHHHHHHPVARPLAPQHHHHLLPIVPPAPASSQPIPETSSPATGIPVLPIRPSTPDLPPSIQPSIPVKPIARAATQPHVHHADGQVHPLPLPAVNRSLAPHHHHHHNFQNHHHHLLSSGSATLKAVQKAESPALVGRPDETHGLTARTEEKPARPSIPAEGLEISIRSPVEGTHEGIALYQTTNLASSPTGTMSAHQTSSHPGHPGPGSGPGPGQISGPAPTSSSASLAAQPRDRDRDGQLPPPLTTLATSLSSGPQGAFEGNGDSRNHKHQHSSGVVTASSILNNPLMAVASSQANVNAAANGIGNGNHLALAGSSSGGVGVGTIGPMGMGPGSSGMGMSMSMNPALTATGMRSVPAAVGPPMGSGFIVGGSGPGSGASGGPGQPGQGMSVRRDQERERERDRRDRERDRERERERERERGRERERIARHPHPQQLHHHPSSNPLLVQHQQQLHHPSTRSGTPSSGPAPGLVSSQPQAVGPNEMGLVGMQASGAMGPWVARTGKQVEMDSIPANDRSAYYTAVNDPRSAADHSTTFFPTLQPNRPSAGNRGVKHLAGSRYLRKNKMFAWAPTWDEDRAERRARRRLKGLLSFVIETTDEVADREGMGPVVAEDGQEDGVDGSDEEEEQLDRKLTLRHLRDSASPPLTGIEVSAEVDLLPMWPPKEAMKHGPNYLEMSASPAVRNTLGTAKKQIALMRTVDDLVDGENGMLTVLGRLKAEMAWAGKKRGAGSKPDARTEDPDEAAAEDETEEGAPQDRAGDATQDDVDMEGDENGNVGEADGETISGQPAPSAARPPGSAPQPPQRNSSSAIPPKPALDSSFLFGTGEPFFVPPGSNVTYEAVDPTTQDPDVMDVYPDVELTPLQKLFVTPTGLTTTIGPSAADPRLQLPLSHPSYPHTTCVRLTPETQKQSVIAALEKIQELSSDCTEYVRRLEQARERIANIGRARLKVWQVIRERAILAHGGETNDGEADVETMRLRAEAEHAIAGTGIETRRRRGVATAVASQVMS